MEQLSLLTKTCCYPGCEQPIVGHSVRDNGWVCCGHNEREWGDRLIRSREWRALGLRLLADSRASLGGTP